RGRLHGLGLDVHNNGGATGHGGAVYDAVGLPTRTAWVGLPSVSTDLEGYATAVFAGLKIGMRDARAFVKSMEHVHPGMSGGEKFTYRHFVLPRLRRELPKIVAARDRALAFHNGGPGLTTGGAALKPQLP